jgi:hypothetical protein
VTGIGCCVISGGVSTNYYCNQLNQVYSVTCSGSKPNCGWGYDSTAAQDDYHCVSGTPQSDPSNTYPLYCQ